MPMFAACLLLAFMSVFSAAPAGAADQELSLFIWSEYLPEEVVSAFSRETGIKVTVATYDSNEAMRAALKQDKNKNRYDLIVPSSDYVGLLAAEGLLQPLNHNQVPLLAGIDRKFLDKGFDPGNTYSVPYLWGSTIIVVNTRLVGAGTVNTLADLWKPELRGKLLLPNDPREVLGLGLEAIGYSINEKDPGRLAAAYNKVKKLMPAVKLFDSDSPKEKLLSGEAAVGVMWSGEAFIVGNEDPDIHIIYPSEGFILWVDSLCIPKNATHVEAAHRFINYLLEPEVAAAISMETGYSTPNSKAMTYIDPGVRNNPVVYPLTSDLARGEFLENIGEQAMNLYNEYWRKLREEQK
ncbi:MAG: extracellular solute-binding protein [Desulfobulbaceae bacterium]|jgi:spermidine/putrescine transport system substrate-binding protein|nr:extracellular solute-binding protein [Desulfobulbaceae bacterium]